jgi:hypothetical protein
MEQKAEPQTAAGQAPKLPQELIDLGCFIENGRLQIPRENAAKVRSVIDRMQRDFRKANRKRGDGKPIMVARVPTKRC